MRSLATPSAPIYAMQPGDVAKRYSFYFRSFKAGQKKNRQPMWKKSFRVEIPELADAVSFVTLSLLKKIEGEI